MFQVWVVFHVIVCIALVLVVLMQSSKGEGLAGSAFGGGGGGGLGGAVFGGRGAASFLSKATSVLAVVFMINCIALAYMSAGKKAAVAGTSETPIESPITKQAQEERDRALQQQQAQQLAGDSGNQQIQILPNEAANDSN